MKPLEPFVRPVDPALASRLAEITAPGGGAAPLAFHLAPLVAGLQQALTEPGLGIEPASPRHVHACIELVGRPAGPVEVQVHVEGPYLLGASAGLWIDVDLFGPAAESLVRSRHVVQVDLAPGADQPTRREELPPARWPGTAEPGADTTPDGAPVPAQGGPARLDWEVTDEVIATYLECAADRSPSHDRVAGTRRLAPGLLVLATGLQLVTGPGRLRGIEGRLVRPAHEGDVVRFEAGAPGPDGVVTARATVDGHQVFRRARAAWGEGVAAGGPE